MKKLILFGCAALLAAGVSFGGVVSEDPGELSVVGQVFFPDSADCDLFKIGYGAQVAYREWFSFPWGAGLTLGVSQWQVDSKSDAFKYDMLSNYDGDVLVIHIGLALYFNVIDWDNWNLLLETGLQYAIVNSSATVFNNEPEAQKKEDVDIEGAILWNLGAEFEYMVAENMYLQVAAGYQLDLMKGDTEYAGRSVRDASFAAGYARIGAKFLF